jgi:hypothetical protein
MLPLAPFDAWPVQVVDDQSGLLLWYLEPAVFVSQIQAKKASLLVIQRLVRLMDDVRALRAQEIEASGGILVFHDWSRLSEGVDPAAGRFLRAAWKKLRPTDVRCVYLAAKLNPLARVGWNGVNFVATRVTGKSMQLADDIRIPMRAHRITAPTLGVQFPVR